MSKLIIGNTLPPEIVGDFTTCTPQDFLQSGHYAQGLLWSAEPGDVLLLATKPSEEFARYVARHLGMTPAQNIVVTPPVGTLPAGLLSPDAVLDSAFLGALIAQALSSGVDAIWPYYYDRMALEIARRLSLDAKGPAFRFFDEGGARLLNSKATFRVLAAGAGLRIATGKATSSVEEAADVASSFLEAGQRVIIKQDRNMGGFGNSLLSPVTCGDAAGTREAFVVPDHEAARRHLTERWSYYSDDDRAPVVVEQYVDSCIPVYAEMVVEDANIRAFGHGEMLMKPIYDGLSVPGRAGDAQGCFDFFVGAKRMAEIVQRMGYRGLMSVDGMITPDGSTFFNEFNCRGGGSTHVHRIGERVVGGDYLRDRIMFAHRIAPNTGFTATVGRIRAAGLAFDSSSRTGIILATDVAPNGKIQYCLVAETLESACTMTHALHEIFGLAGSA